MSNILKLFIEKGFLLDKEMLDFLNELGDEEVANEIIEKIAVASQKKIITKNLVSDNIEKIKPILFELEDEKKKLVDKYFVNVSISVEVKRERRVEAAKVEEKIQPSSVKVLSSPVIASQKLEVKDFVKHFRSRYVALKNIIQTRPELENLISIDKITGNRDFSIIGLVTSKQITKNKNYILEVEDLTGSIKLLINQNKEEIYEKAKGILLDDVIGFRCNGSRDFLFVNDFFYPDCFLKEKKKTEGEVYALFISDIHVGSDCFLEKNFSRFINWLGGGCDEKERETLKKIKYMFVVGDSIDGVGIYPGQEKELVIKDIKKQYERLAEFYRRIPKHITIIQCAGQHDAVRIAEPQPPIGDDFGEALQGIENLFLVSNPSLIEIESLENNENSENRDRVEKKGVVGGEVRNRGGREGIKVLMYHGASMHNIINEVEELRLANAHATPAKVIKHLLLRRHLAPTHSATTYIPDANDDPLLIREVPDIITTGDLHKPDVDMYNGVLIIANSCWQSITPFEEKVGNLPDPCKALILNLKTREIKVLDFSDEDSDEKGGDSASPPSHSGVKEEKCEEVGKEGDSSVDEKEVVCGVEGKK